MTIGVSVAGIVVAVATTATTIGMQEKAKGDAKHAAAIQKADAEQRAQAEKSNQESEQMAQGIASMTSGDPNAGGDPAVQQYLEQMGYVPSGGGQAQPGQPANPPDPSTPRQQVHNARNGTTA